jgi:hypothetical protein
MLICGQLLETGQSCLMNGEQAAFWYVLLVMCTFLAMRQYDSAVFVVYENHRLQKVCILFTRIQYKHRVCAYYTRICFYDIAV